METIERYTRTITFNTINEHLTCDIKERFADIINQERRLKHIKLGNLDRCLHSLGFRDIPILRVLNKTIETETIPFEYYIAMMVICGINIHLNFTDVEHSRKYIKNRKKLMDLFTNKND